MNRLIPLVRRRMGPRASFVHDVIPAFVEMDRAEGWTEDAKLFATGWIAGLVFFGTLFA